MARPTVRKVRIVEVSVSKVGSAHPEIQVVVQILLKKTSFKRNKKSNDANIIKTARNANQVQYNLGKIAR